MHQMVSTQVLSLNGTMKGRHLQVLLKQLSDFTGVSVDMPQSSDTTSTTIYIHGYPFQIEAAKKCIATFQEKLCTPRIAEEPDISLRAHSRVADNSFKEQILHKTQITVKVESLCKEVNRDFYDYLIRMRSKDLDKFLRDHAAGIVVSEISADGRTCTVTLKPMLSGNESLLLQRFSAFIEAVFSDLRSAVVSCDHAVHDPILHLLESNDFFSGRLLTDGSFIVVAASNRIDAAVHEMERCRLVVSSQRGMLGDIKTQEGTAIKKAHKMHNGTKPKTRVYDAKAAQNRKIQHVHSSAYRDMEVEGQPSSQSISANKATANRNEGFAITASVQKKDRNLSRSDPNKRSGVPHVTVTVEAASADDGDQCGVCLGPLKNPKCLPCKHSFCASCMKRHDELGRNCCPVCRMPYRSVPSDPYQYETSSASGNSSNASVSSSFGMNASGFGSPSATYQRPSWQESYHDTGLGPYGYLTQDEVVAENKTPPLMGVMTKQIHQSSLPGYPGCGTIEIFYELYDGIQEYTGKPYSGSARVAYLPDNRDGRRILGLMAVAFESRLTFMVGTSSSGQTDTVIWSSLVTHKTHQDGGQDNYGYPDPYYLEHVEAQLANLGITQANW